MLVEPRLGLYSQQGSRKDPPVEAIKEKENLSVQGLDLPAKNTGFIFEKERVTRGFQSWWE